MAYRKKPRKAGTDTGPQVDDYRHDDPRLNLPPAGLSGYEDPASQQPKKRYEYDPHLDPQLVWAGKAEHTSFEVDSVPLYIHERLSTEAIVRAVRREEVQKSLFADPERPLHEVIKAYTYPENWANRLILGDSLVVMNSLLERERMAGQVQMIYLDPPYGIGYNSNFQPRVDKRDVKDGADEDLTREPEQIKAYRDTWTLGIHSYLTYLRDRLLLARDLLSETGSVFVQISDENLHLVRSMMDEVFGADRYVAVINYTKTSGQTAKYLSVTTDYVLWYAKESPAYNPLFVEKSLGGAGSGMYQYVEDCNCERRRLTQEEVANPASIDPRARPYRLGDVTSQRQGRPSGLGTAMHFPVVADGKTFYPPGSRGWSTTSEGMARLSAANRLVVQGDRLAYVRYIDDFAAFERDNNWTDTAGVSDRSYVVQTNTKVVERCLLMTTKPGDIVLDPTCGSGTTAYVAEQWGRRWITCDTSRVSVFLARQRLLTARLDYYDLADEAAGLDGDLKYKTVPHVTLKSIAQNPELDPERVEARREAIRKANPKTRPEEIERLLREANEAIIRANADQETLYDQPEVARNKVRVSGPFTVEAIPPPSLAAMEETPIGGEPEMEGEAEGGGAQAPALQDTASSAAEHIETLIELLRKDGVTFPNNKKMVFATLTGCGRGFIHAEGEPGNGGATGLKKVALSFGPLYGSITTQQVEDGLREANMGGYDGIIFCGFAFDAEAQAVIAADPHQRVRAFMSHIRPDLLMTDDDGHSLLKTTASSQLFTVFGEPEVDLRETDEGFVVELLGVDIYNPLDGSVSSDRGDKVAGWFVDTDYDGRTFCVCQAFFPDRSAWEKLGRALRGVIDEEKFEMLAGTESLPFSKGKHGKAAVKVIDRRGNEVMVVRGL
ncbi:site-specific DNA-methyltransferase [bacterium]|nr:site-specific DNA-methyltransferase [bacterium]